ncbi:hypothetical protein G6F65_019121 [Rhizopus arrhizus]|nr:hypothetical protein G6F65_019121 [Rhizopus arrhizus]
MAVAVHRRQPGVGGAVQVAAVGHLETLGLDRGTQVGPAQGFRAHGCAARTGADVRRCADEGDLGGQGGGYRGQLVACPVDLFPRDDERWRQAQRVAVGILDQHAACLQAFAAAARAARIGLELHCQHQAASTDLAHGAGQGAQPFQKIGADCRRVLDHAFVGQHLQRGAGHGAGQRIAAEGAAMLARLEHAQHVGVGQHGGHRIEAARQRLADQRDIGFDAFVLFGQHAGVPA